MEPASKKKKVEPIVEAIEKLEKLDMTYHPPSEEQLKDLFREFTAGLRAGSCLIGTEVEEEEYARMLEQDEESEIASGEEKQTVDDEMDVDEPQQQAANVDDTGDSEDEGSDMIVLPDGDVFAVSQYFGREWADMIVSTTLDDICTHACSFLLDPTTFRRAYGKAAKHACCAP